MLHMLTNVIWGFPFADMKSFTDDEKVEMHKYTSGSPIRGLQPATTPVRRANHKAGGARQTIPAKATTS